MVLIPILVLGSPVSTPTSASPATPGKTVPTATSILSTASAVGTTLSSGSTLSTAAATGTTTKRCDEMQAVDESTSKKITVSPTDVPEEQKAKFQPTSTEGVSFPKETVH